MKMAKIFGPLESGAPQDLILAHTRLFTGPGQPLAPAYESVYLEGRLMGEAAVRVAEFYAEASLQVSTGLGELPDHISIELAFMAYLIDREEGEDANKEIWKALRHRFMDRHLARWLPQFCERVQASAAHPFYSEAARELRDLFEADQAPPVIPKRFPDIRLRTDRSKCSLCMLCVDYCRLGGLQADCTHLAISLTFDPANCNGCRACLRACPESAIRIELGAPLQTPRSPARRVVAKANRVICPGCSQPHIALPWYEKLVERLDGDELVTRSLKLCPICKMRDSWPIPVGIPQETIARA